MTHICQVGLCGVKGGVRCASFISYSGRNFSNSDNHLITDLTMNNIDQYGDGYMEPEEEWEREGLLDPAWEKQQKKVRPNAMNGCNVSSQSMK
ncbi:hypothetical protein C0J52_00381 [Blattella germanica]|nr:hypothetical protein C0J52_00381 [Blattella germanica]